MGSLEKNKATDILQFRDITACLSLTLRAFPAAIRAIPSSTTFATWLHYGVSTICKIPRSYLPIIGVKISQDSTRYRE